MSAAAKCVYLRTKAQHISAFAAGAFETEEAPICWCNRTLRELGPDGECAELAPCSDPARECWTGAPG